MEVGEEAIVKTNVGYRLQRIFRGFQGEDGLVVWKIIAKALSIPRGPDETLSVVRVSASLNCILLDISVFDDKLRSQIDAYPQGSLDEEALAPLTSLASGVRACIMHLSSPWATVKGHFRSDYVVAVGYLARMLKNDEVALDSIDLEDLRAALGAARLAVLNDDAVSTEFRRTVLDLLRLLEEALDAYAFGGQPAVQKAIRSFWIAAYAARESIHENNGSSSVHSLREVWLKIKPAMDMAVYSDKLLSLGAKALHLLERLDDLAS